MLMNENELRFVKHFKPKFFVMENVTGILSMETKSGELVKEVILNEYHQAGYNVEIFVLNAAEFGVPQSRMRVFFIGLRNDIDYDKNAQNIQIYSDDKFIECAKDAKALYIVSGDKDLLVIKEYEGIKITLSKL